MTQNVADPTPEQGENERGKEQQRDRYILTIYCHTLSPAPLGWGGGVVSEGVKLCLGERKGVVLVFDFGFLPPTSI